MKFQPITMIHSFPNVLICVKKNINIKIQGAKISSAPFNKIQVASETYGEWSHIKKNTHTG